MDNYDIIILGGGFMDYFTYKLSEESSGHILLLRKQIDMVGEYIQQQTNNLLMKQEQQDFIHPIQS